jgi:hypothetical protein
MAQDILERNREFTSVQIEEILTRGNQQKKGLRFKVTKCGACYLQTPYFIKATDEQVLVEKKDGFTIIHVGDEEQGKTICLKPGNKENQMKFLNWLSYADRCLELDEELEQPADICFDQLGR